jgi:phage shock protein C
MVWVRSKDGIFFGVCKGLAESFGFHPWLLRLILLVAIFFFGVGFMIYLIFAITLPRQDRVLESREAKIMGVCYRLSRMLDMEVGLVRFVFLLLTLSSLGVTLLFYLLLHFLLKPANDDIKNKS